MVVLDRDLALDAGCAWSLRIGFVVLGLLAAGAVLWFLRPEEGTEPKLDPGDECWLVDQRRTREAPPRQLRASVLVLVAGPEGRRQDVP